MIGWFQNLKLQAKLLMLFSTITLLAAISTTWYIFNIIQLNDRLDDAVQEAKELTEVEEVQVFLLEEELSMNNYPITGEEAFLVQNEQSEQLADLYLRQAIVDAASAEERDALNLLSQEMKPIIRPSK